MTNISTSWARVRLVLAGLAVSCLGYLSLQLAHLPNVVDHFLRSSQPIREQGAYTGHWLAMAGALFVILWAIYQKAPPRWLDVLPPLRARWLGTRASVRAGVLVLFALVLVAGRVVQYHTGEHSDALLNRAFDATFYESDFLTQAFRADAEHSAFRQQALGAQVYYVDKWLQTLTNVRGILEGCFLCYTENGRVLALESYSGGDDLGAQVLFRLFVDAFMGAPNTSTNYLQVYVSLMMGVVFIALGAISLAVTVVFRSGLAGFIFFGVIVLLDGFFAHPALFWTYHWATSITAWVACVFIFDLAFIPAERRLIQGRGFVGIFLVYGVVAFLLFSVRSSNGMVQWGFVVLVLVLYVWQSKRWRQAGLAFVAFAGAFLGMQNGLVALVQWRNEAYGVRTENIISHPFSHALYIGLSAATNDYGIEWDDYSVSQACADTDFYSVAYYACIRDAFVRVATTDLSLVVRSLLIKLESILQNTLRFSPSVVFLPLALLVVRSRVFWGLVAVVGGVMMLPALLVMPYHMYLYGYLNVFTVMVALMLLKIPEFIENPEPL